MTNMTGPNKAAATATTNDKMTGPTGLNLLRILISSYFIAVSLSLVKGTDLTALAVLMLPGNLGIFAANTMVFILAYIVLMGMWMRPAVWALASYVLASSLYATTLTASPEIMSDLWRDIALVAGLLLSCISTSGRKNGHNGRGDDDHTMRARAVAGLRDGSTQRRALDMPQEARRDAAEIENIFAV